MQSRQVVSAMLLSMLVLCPLARSQSGNLTSSFTIQVAAFPDLESAEGFIEELLEANENPFWGTVDLPGRGRWIRVFVGGFDTIQEARKYGARLVSEGTIKEFLVRPMKDVKALSRPRVVREPVKSPTRHSPEDLVVRERPTSEMTQAPDGGAGEEWEGQSTDWHPALHPEPPQLISFASSSSLSDPVTAALIPDSILASTTGHVAREAYGLITGVERDGVGGLWVSGDVDEALNRLKWIVGSDNADLVVLDYETGRVAVDEGLLLDSAIRDRANPFSALLQVVDFILANEGLLLLVQLTRSPGKYCLHIGRTAITGGGEIEITGSINLDRNFDRRINPYRRHGQKLKRELPAGAFDALVAINPDARWFNLRARRLVPSAHITFHELAEAYGKVELGLEYLGHSGTIGAHNLALERERILKSQRPFSDVVVTAGANRVLRSEDEVRRLYDEYGVTAGGQR